MSDAKEDAPAEPELHEELLAFTRARDHLRMLETRIDEMSVEERVVLESLLLSPKSEEALKEKSITEVIKTRDQLLKLLTKDRAQPEQAISEQSQRIEQPPASNYILILKSILTRSAYDKVIAPYVAQEQHEYYEALVARDTRQAKVIRLRMYLLLTWLSLREFVSPVIRFITRAG